jgi:hypothetical protein
MIQNLRDASRAIKNIHEVVRQLYSGRDGAGAYYDSKATRAARLHCLLTTGEWSADAAKLIRYNLELARYTGD